MTRIWQLDMITEMPNTCQCKLRVFAHFKMQYSELDQFWYNLLQQQVDQRISELLMLQQMPEYTQYLEKFAETENFEILSLLGVLLRKFQIWYAQLCSKFQQAKFLDLS